MYTRCPNCSTIFRVSAAQLRVALGEVSCGSCHQTFNALSALTEDLPELTEVVVPDPAGAALQNEARGEPEPPAPDTDELAEPLEFAGRETVDSEPADVSLRKAVDETAPEERRPGDPGDAWAEPDDAIDIEIGVETDVNDDLIDTFVDETAAAIETPAEPLELDQEAGPHEQVDADPQPYDTGAGDTGDPGMGDPGTGDPEPESADDSEPTDSTGDARAGEPRYDDHTGIEEILTGFDEGEIDVSREESAAGAWAGILAEVHEDDLVEDRRELEAEALASRAIDDESASAPEPAYDDHTGIEEILHEGDFADRDDVESEPEPDDLEFDAPEQSWPDIFSPADSRQTPFISAAIDTESEQEPLPDEPLDLSPLSALESETADPDEWANLLTEVTTDRPDEQPGEAAPEAEPDDGTARPIEFDYDESNSTEIILSSSEPLPIVRESVAFADSVEPEYAAPGNGGKPVDPLIDYEPGFVPPWESEPAEPSGDGAVSILKVPKRRIAIAALLIVALGLQLIHYNRDSIARHPSWGPRIQSVYSALGSELYPGWNLSSYRITGSEAIAGRTDKAALDIIANVTIAGDETVSLPLVRIALQDRWGNTVASRVFKPNEYLSDFATWPDRLSPGTTIPVEISVADPGTDAHGYIVDVCLPRRTAGLQCQIQTEPFRP